MASLAEFIAIETGADNQWTAEEKARIEMVIRAYDPNHVRRDYAQWIITKHHILVPRKTRHERYCAERVTWVRGHIGGETLDEFIFNFTKHLKRDWL